MKVFKVTPRGYCKGVVRAIRIAKQCVKEYPDQPIFILGMIVHNQYIVDALEKINIHTVDSKNGDREELLDKIEHGVVIITAHGTSDKVILKAKEKGLTVVDATCKDVIKTHDLIKKWSVDHDVLYIGKKGHPESEGSVAISNKVHLIQNKSDIDQYISLDKKFVVTNQTTMSIFDVKDLCNYANLVLKDVTILPETCNATTIRQQAMINLPEEVDILYVVGDPRSNNSNKLKDIALKSHAAIDVYMISSVEEIHLEQLKGKHFAAVTSGASTPTTLTNQVIHYLENFNEEDPETYTIPSINYDRILN